MKPVSRFLFLLLMLSGLSLLAGGCHTDDEPSSRAWNAPKAWENGLPSNMTEGR